MAQRVAERMTERRVERSEIVNGPAAAAILASGIGCLTLGILTTLSEASAAVNSALNLYPPAGPLSGKTIVSIIVWLVAWVALHFAWSNKQVDYGRVFTTSLVLVALGFLGTFPIFFDLFA